jgi:hypothetical protein
MVLARSGAPIFGFIDDDLQFVSRGHFAGSLSEMFCQ